MGWSSAKIVKGLYLLLCVTIVLAGTGIFLWHPYQGEKQTVTGIPQNPDRVVGIVIPHHDMVAAVRGAYVKQIAAAAQPETIVLIAPDHFNANQYPIVGSDQAWNTSVGTLEPDSELLTALGFPIEPGGFFAEHGVTTLLKELKINFPNARLAPYMMSRTATYAEVADFAQKLYAHCPECLLVASVDFSHSPTADLAYLHDRIALRELHNGDAAALYREAEVDSPEALATLALWAQLQNAKRFELFSHTNSGHLAGTVAGEMTSHIIGGYTGGKIDTTYASEVTLMIGGDVLLTQAAPSINSPFSALGDRFFWGADVTLVNLEGVFSNESNLASGWHTIPPRLRYNPAFVPLLKAARINTVGLANNHTNDGTDADLDLTQQVLEGANIELVGYAQPPGTKVRTIVKGQTRAAIIAASYDTEPNAVISSVKNFSGQGYEVVAFMHWGLEFTPTHTPQQQHLAEALIDAGADVVVGSHPHVVQDVAVYKGRPIVYSLGNLLSMEQPFPPESEKIGLVLNAIFAPAGIQLGITPISTDGQPEILSETDYRAYVAKLTVPWQEYIEPTSQLFFFSTDTAAQ